MINSILCCSPHRHAPKTNQSMATNPFACSVLIRTGTRRDEKQLKKAIKPLMTWIDPCLKLIQISKSHHAHPYDSKPAISPPTLRPQKRKSTFRVPCPAVSIMLFLQENGVLGCRELQKCFNQSPWRLHHRIELVNVHSPDRTLADQRFYQADTDTPLWSVCPIDVGREHLRINIFVRNFPAMIEFYRIITGVEMESNKENFCWFLIYSQPGLEIRLSLKYAENVDPYPLETVQLLFEVNNVQHIKTALGVELKFIGSDCYSMNDPDGNFVVLHTTKNIVCPLFNARCKEELSHRRNYANEFRDDLATRMSSSTDTNANTPKFSTLPRNFSYFKRSISTSNDSGLFTGSEGGHINDSGLFTGSQGGHINDSGLFTGSQGGHINDSGLFTGSQGGHINDSGLFTGSQGGHVVDDLDIPAGFKRPPSLNSSQRFLTGTQEMTARPGDTFTDQLRKRLPVDRHNSTHVSFRSDNGHVRRNKNDFSQRRIDHHHKMAVSAEDLCAGQLAQRYPIKRHNSTHLSFKSDNGYFTDNKDPSRESTHLSSQKYGNNRTHVRPVEQVPRMNTAVRRSNSAVIDFSKYVIKESTHRTELETTPIVSEEIFV